MVLPFALLFTIALAVILLLGAIIIWKSSLPANDKLMSLVIIMALFAAVSIVNEYKRTKTPSVKAIQAGEIPKNLFTPSITDRDLESQVFQSDHHRNLIEESLEGWNPVNSSSYSLSFLYSEKNTGVSTAWKKHAKNLQVAGHPVLYLELKHPEFTLLDFMGATKISELRVIDEAVKKLNDNNKVPTIIIDNIENALNYEENRSNRMVCPLCKYLVALYDTHRVNVVLLSSDAHAKDMLAADYTLSSKISFQELQEAELSQLENYLLEKGNENIPSESKKFKTDNIKKLHHTLGWNYGIMREYLDNLGQYNSVNDFVERKVQSEAKRIAALTEIKDLLKVLLSLTEEKKDNAWISYATIRKVYEGNPAKKIDDALNADILCKEKNLYRFANANVYNAALTAKENGTL